MKLKFFGYFLTFLILSLFFTQTSFGFSLGSASDPDLKLWFDFNGSYDGKIQDLSSNSNDGTIYGGELKSPAECFDGVSGKNIPTGIAEKGCMEFNGDSIYEYLDFSGNAMNEFKTFSIWFNAKNIDSGPRTWTKNALFFDNGDNTLDNEFAIYLYNENTISFGWGSAGYEYDLVYNNIQKNTWYNALIIINDDLLKLYINGELVDTNISNPQILSYFSISPKPRFGNHPGYSGFNGSIADVKIFSRVLSDLEIQSLYEKDDCYISNINEDKILDWNFNVINSNNLKINTIFDASTYNNNGASVSSSNSPEIKSGGECITDKCLKFDGVNDYVYAIDNGNLDLVDDFAMSFWVKTNGNNDILRYILSKCYNYRVKINEENIISLDFMSSGAWRSVVSTSPLIDNTWYNISFSYDGVNLKLYKNSILEASQPLSYVPATCSTDFYLNGYSGSYGDFSGYLDDIKIWNRSLSGVEISYLYNNVNENLEYIFSDNSIMDDSLIAYWTFDEETGNIANDYSIYGHDLDLYFNPTWKSSDDCVLGSCLSFDGVNDYLNSQNTEILDVSGSNNLTISFWANFSLDGGDVYSILSKGEDSQYGLEFIKATRRVGFSDNICDTLYTPSYAFDFGRFYNLTVSYNGLKKAIYIDGEKKAESSCSGNFSNNFEDIILGKLGGSNFFSGILDEVKIWNRSLSEAEIKTNYNLTISFLGDEKVSDFFDSGDYQNLQIYNSTNSNLVLKDDLSFLVRDIYGNLFDDDGSYANIVSSLKYIPNPFSSFSSYSMPGRYYGEDSYIKNLNGNITAFSKTDADAMSSFSANLGKDEGSYITRVYSKDNPEVYSDFTSYVSNIISIKPAISDRDFVYLTASFADLDYDNLDLKLEYAVSKDGPFYPMHSFVDEEYAEGRYVDYTFGPIFDIQNQDSYQIQNIPTINDNRDVFKNEIRVTWVPKYEISGLNLSNFKDYLYIRFTTTDGKILGNSDLNVTGSRILKIYLNTTNSDEYKVIFPFQYSDNYDFYGNNEFYGYAWGDSTGFISFSGLYDDNTRKYGVYKDFNKKLYGYAWSETIGWISFAYDSNLDGDYVDTGEYQVYIDENNRLQGQAWSENCGYLNFSNDENGDGIYFGDSDYETYIDSYGDLMGNAYFDQCGFVSFYGNNHKVNSSNISLSHKGYVSLTGSDYFSSDKPYVVTKFTPEITDISSFTESLVSGSTGSTSYQVSTDSGRTWLVYDGNSDEWTVASIPGVEKRKRISFNNYLDYDLNNYTVKFNISHEATMNSNFSDVKFTAADGISYLDYYLESYTPSSFATFWVDVPEVLANDSSYIYMYWEDEFASSSSSVTLLTDSPNMGGEGIIAAWDFNDQNLLDSTLNNYDGSIVNNPNWKSGFSCVSGGCLECSSSNRFELSQIEELKNNNLSLSFFLKLNDYSENQNILNSGLFRVYHRGGWAGDGRLYFLYRILENETPYDSSWPYWTGVSSDILLDLDTWYHIVLEKSGENMKIYINGELDKELNAISGYNIDENSLGILRSDSGNFVIDDLKIYGRTLGVSEIEALYKFPTTLINMEIENIEKQSNTATELASNISTVQYTIPGISGYTKRKRIDILDPDAYKKKNVKINYNLIWDEEDMQRDFDDIRFTKADGTNEILYEMITYQDSVFANFDILVPEISGVLGEDYIYVYYGHENNGSENEVSTTSSDLSSYLPVDPDIMTYESFEQNNAEYESTSIMIKAFLESDSSKFVGIDEIELEYGRYGFLPYIETLYGNVYSGGSIDGGYDAMSPNTNATYLVLGNGTITRFTSSMGEEGIDDSYGAIVFPNRENKYISQLGRIDIKGIINEQYGEVYNTNPISGPLNGNVYYREGDINLSSLLINNALGDNSGAGLLLVKGNLYINGDIMYQEGSVTNIKNLASFGIIVIKDDSGLGGNIYIDDHVMRVDGNIYAEGSIDTGESNYQLLVNGLMMASDFDFLRKKGFIAGGSERVVYDGRILVNTPPGMQDIASSLPTWDIIMAD